MELNSENILTPAFIYDIIDACEKLDKSNDVNVIFLSSGVEKYFCNGLDPVALHEEGFEACFQAIMDMVSRLYSLKKPMIACINGYALAGGAILGILADYRFITPGSKYAFNEILLGLTMSQMIVDIIQNAVGPFHAKHLCQTGMTVKADKALEMGLADNIFEDGQLYQKSLAFAKRLALLNSESLCYIKKIFRREVISRAEKYKQEDQEAFSKCLKSPILANNFKRLLERSQKRG